MTSDRERTPNGAQEEVERCGRYAGHASAMCILNSMIRADDNRIAAWDAEERAWERRINSMIDRVPFGQLQLRMDALGAICAASSSVDPVGVMRDFQSSRTTIEQSSIDNL